jgi:hypothetical protein
LNNTKNRYCRFCPFKSASECQIKPRDSDYHCEMDFDQNFRRWHWNIVCCSSSHFLLLIILNNKIASIRNVFFSFMFVLTNRNFTDVTLFVYHRCEKRRFDDLQPTQWGMCSTIIKRFFTITAPHQRHCQQFTLSCFFFLFSLRRFQNVKATHW